MRVFESFGVFTAMIIEIGKQLAAFTILLAFVLVAFSHALFLLLRQADVTSPTTYNGTITHPAGGDDTVTLQEIEIQSEILKNPFDTFWLSLHNVYFFLVGDYSSLEMFGD